MAGLNWRDWLSRAGMTSLRLNMGFLETEFMPKDADRKAAWDLYVELLTRVATQPIAPDHGDEKTALDSIHSLFATTRQVLKDNGPGCQHFAQIAVVVLNQIVRPFTAKWHRMSMAGAFSLPENCGEFRKELAALQVELSHYTRMLADMAGVEDLRAADPPPRSNEV